MNYYQLYVENNKKIFTYKSLSNYNIGDWCIINFSNRKITGLIIKKIDFNDLDVEEVKIKEIESIASIATIPKEIIELAAWIKNYYLSDYYNIIKTIYPGTLKLKYSENAVFISKFDISTIIDDSKLIVSEEENNEIDHIKELNDYLEKKKEITYITLKKKFDKKIIKQFLKNGNIKIEKKLIINKKIKEKRYQKNYVIDDKIILNDEQNNAFETIRNGEDQIYLLKGVTGSGKTEVYIKLIEEAVKNNEGAILLVPEISLTPQIIERIELKFENHAAILHSKLTDKEKREEWYAIRSGEKKIVIGARSAIFAPVSNLKYIIIDEEHENTYKQDNNPRYHTKNVAIKRSILETMNKEKSSKVKVILGSATPSFETYYQAKTGDIKLIELSERFNGAKLPTYEVVDLNDEMTNFSNKLLKEMSTKLKNNEQIILILNRKAYSTFVKCKDCGHTYKCPNCSITLNHYKNANKMKCNYCGYEEKISDKCNNCGSDKLLYLGSGTEKIEEELYAFFPDAKIIRADAETIKTRSDYDKLYNDFKNKKYDIMIGTQIIAKGFHFPNVTLVGIINADIIMNFPDFRAGEKTYQLLSQSSGRSGRGEKEGKVIIQTYDVDNDVILKTVKNDYEGYYKDQLMFRQLFNYPPFGKIINIIFSSQNEENLENKVIKFYDILLKNIQNQNIKKNEIISKPFRAALHKINNRYRYQIFIKMERKDITRIKNVLKISINEYSNYNYKDVRVSVDVDPINLM